MYTRFFPKPARIRRVIANARILNLKKNNKMFSPYLCDQCFPALKFIVVTLVEVLKSTRAKN